MTLNANHELDLAFVTQCGGIEQHDDNNTLNKEKTQQCLSSIFVLLDDAIEELGFRKKIDIQIVGTHS